MFHVKPTRMNETLSHCPLCNNQEVRLFLSGEDFFLTHEEVVIVECCSCGFRYTNPRPAMESSGSYYQTDEYISHDASRRGLIPAIYGFARKFTLRSKFALARRYSPGDRILDIGCGTGEFLDFCQKKGLRCTGVEPSEKARNFAKSTYGLQVEEDFLTGVHPSERFDCITLWHVLEHIHPLDETMSKLNGILNPNGMVIIALPNCNAYDARYYGRFWAAYDLPRHIYHFTKRSLSILAENYQFTLETMIPQKLDAFYISLLSEKYMKGSTHYMSALFRGLLSNLKGRDPQFGYSSEIYILKRKNS